MDVYAYLKQRIKVVRDGYTATPRERRKLYLWLKLNDGWQQVSIKAKLGHNNYAWLEGLVAYGDKHEWFVTGVLEESRGVERNGR